MHHLAFHRSYWLACVLAAVVATAAVAEEPTEVLRSLFNSIEEELDAQSDGGAQTPEESENAPGPLRPGHVNCAILTYGNGKTSRCFSNEFLSQISRETHINCNPKFVSAMLESTELFECPFAVMTGEGGFDLTEAQRVNMRNYLENGGFIIASAGCSSEEWQASFRQAIASVFPDVPLRRLEASHPVFHTVYDIRELKCKGTHQAHLEGLELDGKIVLIFSPDGLNDTGKAGPRCCCCGGNEIQNARQMNVNLLAYTLTH
jgi:hypothetical protein